MDKELEAKIIWERWEKIKLTNPFGKKNADYMESHKEELEEHYNQVISLQIKRK